MGPIFPSRLVRLFSLVLVSYSGAMNAQMVDKFGHECLKQETIKEWDKHQDLAVFQRVAGYFTFGECGCPVDGPLSVKARAYAFQLAINKKELDVAATSAFLIGACYQIGPCRPDPVESYAWINVSLSLDADMEGNATTRESLNEAVAKMTLDTFARAQQRSQAIMAAVGEELTRQKPEKERPAPPERSFGTAFFVSSEGHAVTNHHVIEGCRFLKVGKEKATVVADDRSADLTVLRAGPKRRDFATFRDGGGVTAGTSVVVVGYPLPGLLASADPNVTTGVVSALAGPSEDRRYFQVTAPIQPGNSGGPLLDSSGNVIGVIVATLSTVGVANATGAIPQNLNFAIKAPAVRALLESNEIPFQIAKSVQELKVSEVAARARRFTEQVECTK